MTRIGEAIGVNLAGSEFRIPGGTFRMGSDRHYPVEAPAHRVGVDGFCMDRTPVTNARGRAFVETTGHITFAELPPPLEDYPGAPAELLRAGSLVFVKQPAPDVPGADRRHPRGPGSDILGLDDHPVVHTAQGPQGRLPPVRPEQLPPLAPASSTPTAHRHYTCHAAFRCVRREREE